jgi:hypothetical protein
VLYAKGLHFKPNNARKISDRILVVEDRVAQMVVQEEFDLSLALLRPHSLSGSDVILLRKNINRAIHRDVKGSGSENEVC